MILTSYNNIDVFRDD